MKKGKKHIIPQKRGEYPQPDTPADEAWNVMKDMLDQQMPLSTDTSFQWIKAVKVVAWVLAASAGLLYLFFNQADLFQNTSTSEIPKKVNTPIMQQMHDKQDPKNNRSGDADASETGEMPRSLVKSKMETSPAQNDSTSLDLENKTTNSDKKLGTEIHAPSTEAANSSPKNARTRAGRSVSYSSVTQKIRVSNNLSAAQPPRDLTDRNVPGRSTKSADRGNTTPLYNKPVDNAADLTTYQSLTQADKDRKKETRNNSIPEPQTRSDVFTGKKHDLISMINSPALITTNDLAQKLSGSTIQPVAMISPTSKHTTSGNIRVKTVHAGLLWSLNTPFSGYDHYFEGTGNSNDFYKTFLPGVWVGKTLPNGGEIQIKLRPYNENFGNPNTYTYDSSRVQAGDSMVYSIITTRQLLKSSGVNLGIQYIQPLYDRWSLGIGAHMQWQNKALLSNEVKSSRPHIIIDYDPVITLTPKNDTAHYLKPHFFTTQIEVSYSWKKLQFGVGMTLPISSMVAKPNRTLKPASGQVTIRWRVR